MNDRNAQRRAVPRLPPIAHSKPPASAPGSARSAAVQERGGHAGMRSLREQMLGLHIDDLHVLVLEVVAEYRERLGMENEESKRIMKKARLKRRLEYGSDLRKKPPRRRNPSS